MQKKISPGLVSLLKNATYLSGARIVTVLARFIYVLVIARLLGPQLYGLFNYGMSWYLLFLPLSVLGLDFILMREIGRRDDQAIQLVRASMSIRGFSAIFVAMLSVGIAFVTESQKEVRILIVIFSIALAGRGLASWSNAIFNGSGKSVFVLTQELSFRLLEVLFGVLLVFTGQGIVALAAVHAVSWLAQGLNGLRLVRRHLYPNLTALWNIEVFKKLLTNSLPFLLSAFLLSWLMQGGILLYRHISGFTMELGQLSLVFQIFVIIGSVLTELGTAAVPVLARSSDRRDGKTAVFSDISLRLGWLITSSLTIFALTLGPWLLVTLFGSRYSDATVLLPWATTLVGPLFWVTSLRSVLAAHGMYRDVAMSLTIGVIAFTSSYLLSMTIESNAVPVLISTGLGLSVTVIVQLWLLDKKEPVLFMVPFIKSGFIAIASISVCYFLKNINIFIAFLGGGILLILGALFYGIIPIGIFKRTTARTI